MDTPDLTSARFWEGDDNHIAIDPLRPGDAEGLAAFAADNLMARGWCFFQTSGSEGLPKWVGLTKDAFLISARSVNAFFDVTQSDRWLVALPVHHVGGFAIYARCFTAKSSAHRMNDAWSPDAFATLCANQSATLASLVPTQVFDLVHNRIPSPPELRAVIVGGGALSPALHERAKALGWRVCSSYGMTEAASQIATQSSEDGASDDPRLMEVLPHWHVETDAKGVLTIRGPALAKGYASCDAKGIWNWQAIDPQAGLRTRDRVRLSQHGTRRQLEFMGRDSAFIKVCGELVNRDALQRRLDEAASATGFSAGAVIVPVDDPRRGTTIVIAAEGAGSSSMSRAVLKERFNASCLPFERASAVHEVSVIPRSSLGKVRIAELAALLGAD